MNKTNLLNHLKHNILTYLFIIIVAVLFIDYYFISNTLPKQQFISNTFESIKQALKILLKR